MLSSLLIKNFAIIEDLDVHFEPGFSVITGETGAGKSIIIDALSLLLGERSSFDQIRNGADRAFIEGGFFIENKDNISLINELVEDLIAPEEGILTITRSLDSNGRSILRMNGRIITLALSRQITAFLIDIHSQHDNIRLLDEHRHLHLLDEYIGVNPIKNKYIEAYQNLKKAQNDLSTLDKIASNPEEIDFLKSQIDEINDLKMTPGEVETLEKRIELLRSLEKISLARDQLDELLNGDRGAITDLYLAQKEIDNLGDDFSTDGDNIRSHYFDLRDLSDSIISRIDALLDDDEDIETIANRLYRLKKVIRKYGSSEEDVFASLAEMNEKVQLATSLTSKRQGIINEITQAEINAKKCAEELSSFRKNKANILASAINRELKDLALEHAHFDVRFLPQALDQSGIDQVAFMLAANVGSPFLPIRNAISGGEASRLMLALKIVFRQLGSAETLIFDEVDTGISGRIASIVGKKIRQLASDCQIIAITHLAQVASYATYHYLVEKTVVGDTTKAAINRLDYNQTIQALAKMLGGNVVSTAVLQAATELKKEAEEMP